MPNSLCVKLIKTKFYIISCLKLEFASTSALERVFGLRMSNRQAKTFIKTLSDLVFLKVKHV